MATTIFVVRVTIAADQEEAFNHWYNTEHCPQVLRFRGAVSARRYKTIIADDDCQYMAVYEFESEETFNKFMDSDHLVELKSEYDANFGDASKRQLTAYTQVWP